MTALYPERVSVGRRGAITGPVSDSVSVLDVDAGLADVLPADQLQIARQATTAAVVRVPAGPWRSAQNAERARGGYGMLLLDGLLIRRVGVEGRYGAELLGPGDLLRPWQRDGDGEDAGTLQLNWTWRVAAPARLAVLDQRWSQRAAGWPQLGAELAGRALARSLRLVVAMAVAQQPRLDVRLWMLFWDLADRYGRVRADGVHVELPLTHEILSHLAGARRPSVSAALTRLASDGRVRREGQRWILSGEPPALNGE
jgi:CRP/FNR family transcriptional regulator, cyclic AMP receptor protein